MRKYTIPIINMVFILGLLIYIAKTPSAVIVSDWRDAPADISFEEAGSFDAEVVRSYENENIPSAVNPIAVESKETPDFYPKMLNACSQKFGGDTSILKNSFLRIPSMTRNAFVSRIKKCQFDYDGAISDTNCAGIVECVNAVVKTEKNMLGISGAGNEDDDGEFYVDLNGAAWVYKSFLGRQVSYDDYQDGSLKLNWERFSNSGEANFNPNFEETENLRDSLEDAIQYGKITQGELIHEAILATNGNITMGMGSLAKIFHDNRSMIRSVQGMRDASGKNYYRFVGMYVGLHKSWLIRNLGTVAGDMNIAGNPVVYGVDRVVRDFWKATKFALDYYGLKDDANAEPVDFKETAKVFGPEGRGNLIDKYPEYYKGLCAAVLYRKNVGLE